MTEPAADAPTPGQVEVRLRPLGTQEPGSAGRARLVRYSAGVRAAWAAGFVVAGFVGGAAFIVIPILHLCTTWALPLGGILAGLRAWVTEVAVCDVEGPCPVCGQVTRLEGGHGAGPHADDCAHCRKPLEVLLEPGAA